MREIQAGKVTEVVRRLCMEANYFLGEDVEAALRGAMATEESPVGRDVLAQILENARLARVEQCPICQDTGAAVVFVELGQDVHVTGDDFAAAINEGVRQGYRDGYLRKSMCHPVARKNTGDNTPAVIYTEIVPGDRIRLTVVPKGGGSENMSQVKMLTPAAGVKGVRDFAVKAVVDAGPNPCPPVVVGVGVGGGTFDQVALLAKKALLREVGRSNPDPELARLEADILDGINRSGVGPQGLGGRTTALWVAVEMLPCHIASFPAAVNINCHVARHKEALI
jgi:fumarate hydratase subunit alpha